MREILTAAVIDVEKRLEPNKHYVYCIEVTWNDGTKQMIGRKFTEIFEMHRTLLETFPNEAGKHDSDKRIIPFLPGKVLFKRSDKTKELTLSRIPHIDDYCRKLVILPRIGNSHIVLSFFEMNSTDMGIKKGGSVQNESGSASSITGPMLVEKYVAIAEYKAESKAQVSLQVGDPVDVVKKTDSGWWIVVNASGMNGWVPAAYIWKEGGTGEEDLSSQIYEFEGSWYIAIQSYTAKSDAELSFPSGAEILVYEKRLDGWWNVRYNGLTGEVPGSYLEKDTRTNVNRNTVPEMPETLAPKVPYMDQSQSTMLENEQDDDYVAMCDVTNPMEGELEFRSGDTVKVLDRSDDLWWLAYVGSREGWVNPYNLSQKKSSTPSYSSATSSFPGTVSSLSSDTSSFFSNLSSVSSTMSPGMGKSPNLPRKRFQEPNESPTKGKRGPERPPQPDFNKSSSQNRLPSPPRSKKNNKVGDEWLNTYKTPFSTPQIGNLEKIAYRGDKPAQDPSNLHISSKGKHTTVKEYGSDYFPEIPDFLSELNQLQMGDFQPQQSKPIESELWFKDVTRQVAERALLTEGREGYFIVRRSQASNCPYSMTLLHNGSIINFHIRRRPDNQFATGAYSEGETTFSSVKEMVDFYGRSPLAVGENTIELKGTPPKVGGLTHF